MEHLNSRRPLGFLIVLIATCLQANALECACNIGDGSCRANRTCVLASNYGHCLRSFVAESPGPGIDESEFLLACSDDVKTCEHPGAFCCRSGRLCNAPERLGQSGFVSDRRVVRSLSDHHQQRRRRRRRLPASILDGLTFVPEPSHKRLRCLCHDPITGSFGCQRSHSNRSICKLPEGGWCARSWTVDANDNIQIRDSCVPKQTGFLCEQGHQVHMKCCSNRKLCQSDLQIPPGISTGPPVTTTATPTSETTTAGGPGCGSKAPSWNSTWRAGEQLRCVCNSGRGCNKTLGWCSTNGLCYHIMSNNMLLTSCVSAKSAPSYQAFCDSHDSSSKSSCCTGHCCNCKGSDPAKLQACQKGLSVRPIRQTPIPAPTMNTTSETRPSKPTKPAYAKVCHCTNCANGSCTSDSGVCSVEMTEGGMFRRCLEKRELRLYCKRSSAEKVQRANADRSSSRGNPVYCCAHDNCNQCNPHFPKVACDTAVVNCSCSTCSSGVCSRLGGSCYANSNYTDRRCIGTMTRTLCDSGMCCNGTMCNSPPLPGYQATGSITPRTAANTHTAQHQHTQSIPSDKVALTPSSTPSKATAGSTEGVHGGPEENTQQYPLLLVVIIAACLLLIVATSGTVVYVVCKYRSNTNAAAPCKTAVQRCAGKTKQGTNNVPPPYNTGTQPTYNPILAVPCPDKLDDRSNTSTSTSASTPGESTPSDKVDNRSNASSTIVDSTSSSLVSSSTSVQQRESVS
ncbi:uncharacterized protein LOC135806372 isoform X2 [Sycon ciliatum]|uniref:uncharacterized protein LOC135806372 isoform X2 n=1 Tax=Sycon ciliatum TaxID=27933 RepID=UPI0031F6038D